MQDAIGPVRVGIDARLEPAVLGGVEQAIIGLAHGLSRLDVEDEFLFLVNEDASEWIAPYICGPSRLVLAPARPRQSPLPDSLLRGRRWDSVIFRFAPLAKRFVKIPEADGLFERVGHLDVLHFATQAAFKTSVPSIYQPYDLQHLRFPEFFSARTVVAREVRYRLFCSQARLVVAMTSWGRDDVIRSYGLAAGKVKVVPVAPVLEAYPSPLSVDIRGIQKKFDLPPSFALYPAHTWAHKNHVRLLEALAVLRDRNGLEVPLVCSGRPTAFFPAIQTRTTELGLSGQVRYLGFVTPSELQCLYRLARCLVFPSLFEGWGMPIIEAFSVQLPTACSSVRPISDIAGDAAVLFDPLSCEGIADALLDVWTNEPLRCALIARGKKRVGDFSWDLTARLFRAHYRSVAGRRLTPDEQRLLNASPVV